MPDYMIAIWCLISIGMFIEFMDLLPESESNRALALTVLICLLLAILWPLAVGSNIAKRLVG